MAELTWRNVDAPSSAEALTGLELSNRLFNKALASGQSGIDQIQQMQRDAADRAILARMNGITDPVAYEEAMRQGQIVGPDSQNASMAMLEKAASQGSVLTTRADAAENLRKDLYTNQRTEGFNAADDLFSSEYGNWQTAVKSGDLSALDTLTKTDAFRGLSLNRQKEMTDGFRAAIRDKVGLDSTLQSMRIRSAEEGRAAEAERKRKEEEAFQKEFTAWILPFKRMGASQDDINASLFNKIDLDKLSPEKTARYVNALAQHGVETPYSQKFIPENPNSSGSPEEDAAAETLRNFREANYNSRIRGVEENIARNATVDNIPINQIQALNNDTRLAKEIIPIVTGKGGALEGANPGQLQTLFDEYSNRGLVGPGEDQISPAYFFELVSSSKVGKDPWYSGYFTNTNDIGLKDFEIDEDAGGVEGKLTTKIKQALRKDVSRKATEFDFSNRQKASLQAAKQEVEAADVQLKNAMRMARKDPSGQGAGAVSRQAEALKRAQAKFDSIIAEIDKKKNP